MRDTKEYPWKIGSVTKSFTGTMILQMLDEGTIVLDAPVSDYLLGVPNGHSITVRQIDSMRSGLYNYSESDEFGATNQAQPYRIWLPAELFALGHTSPPYFPPGQGFHYSNTNAVVLGMVIERLNPRCDGRLGNYVQELNKRMLQPLGLEHTSMPATILEPCVHGYVPLQDGTFEDVTNYNEAWTWSAGQMVSTLSDMHRYARTSIAQHTTISDNATRQQRRWDTHNVVEDDSYGFQMEKLGQYIGHNGSLPGYSCYVMTNLATRTTVVVMCNLQFALDGVSPAREIMKLIIKHLP